jgi:sugar lactone lactonase YvrE
MKFNFCLIFSLFVILATQSGCTKDEENVGVNDYQVNEIGTGAAIHGANGITLGPDGSLYIASFLGKEIIVMNKQNGTITNRIGLDKGVKSPDDLVFGPDGSMYWTDILLGEVVRRTPAGVTTRQFVASGCQSYYFFKGWTTFCCT